MCWQSIQPYCKQSLLNFKLKLIYKTHLQLNFKTKEKNDAVIQESKLANSVNIFAKILGRVVYQVEI